jgi:hypothetical protein
VTVSVGLDALFELRIERVGKDFRPAFEIE